MLTIRLSETPCRVIGLAPGQEAIHILVVDDQKSNRELLRMMLEPLGFNVNEASNGIEAIEKVNSLKPRVVLMDLVMPGMDGGEATRILRRSYAMESLIIIGITASTFEKEKQQFLDAGINAYLAKPFREQELFNVLSEYAAVQFETQDNQAVCDTEACQELPALDRMSPEWCEEFRQALVRKSITRIRKLGEKAKEIDPVLSVWLMERAALYDLDGLNRLGCSIVNGVNHG